MQPNCVAKVICVDNLKKVTGCLKVLVLVCKSVKKLMLCLLTRKCRTKTHDLNCSYNICFNQCGLPFGITKCYRKDVELIMIYEMGSIYSVVLVNIASWKNLTASCNSKLYHSRSSRIKGLV